MFSRAFPAGRVLLWSSAELKTEARNSSEFCEIWGQNPLWGYLDAGGLGWSHPLCG